MTASNALTPLRLLIVEDDERDTQLMLRELRRGGFDVTWERVETSDAMAAALAGSPWDLIISDYSMPRFSALLALSLMKEKGLDLPFIIVSGTVGEDIAVEALHAGAHDFVAKGKLARLIPAIERELRDVALRVEQEKMKEQLLISERMASVGTLAAGVAHEINNPLAALMANIDFAAEDLAVAIRERNAGESPSEGLRATELALKYAKESAERIRLIVRDLKVFSRGDEEKPGAIDVVKVLRSSVRIAGNEIRHRAQLVEEYGAVPAVVGMEGQLGQVFLNLIVNAAQAIPEGNADKHQIRVVTREDERGRAVIEITDSGAGIPEAILSRMFDPFFTTKPVGVGTGLGLAICHRIVTGLGGQISVQSVVGRGTTVSTVLPGAAEAPAAATAAAVAASPSTSMRRGRVLIVDDEQMLGNAIKRILRGKHEAEAVTRARDAVERLLAGEPFDVILCDIMMPEMSGMDLHAELTRRAPELVPRIVFMTGGAFTSRARDFLENVSNKSIEKPVDSAHLLAVIQDVLAAQPGS